MDKVEEKKPDFDFDHNPNFARGRYIKEGYREFAYIKGIPCKITDVTFSKTGKVGRPKVRLVGIGIFDNKKYENIYYQKDDDIKFAEVTKPYYEVVDIDEKKVISYLEKNGDMEQIEVGDSLPNFDELLEDFKDGEEVQLQLLVYGNQKKVIKANVLECCSLFDD